MFPAQNDRARVYVAAEVYTKSDVCAAFLRQAERRGLLWVDRGAGQDGLRGGRRVEGYFARAGG